MEALTRTSRGWNWKTQSSSFVEIYSIHLGGGTFICSDLQLSKTVLKILSHWFEEVGAFSLLFVQYLYLEINLSLYIQPARIGSIIIIQIANDSICLSLWLNDCKERIFPLISNLSSLSSLSSFNSAELDSPLPSLPPLFVARDRCSRGLHTHVDGCSKVLLHINYPCVPYLVNGPRIQRYE